MENRRFTNTALPVFSGAESWYQHLHIVQAIVKLNGWPEETAALQLFVHLKGEALNVALLLTKEKRESWTGLVSGLSASKILQKTIGGGPYPRAAVAAAAQGPRASRASVHMEALGLWRPSLDPICTFVLGGGGNVTFLV